jgi:thiol-disulfide isomerase/thioredoxin
MRKRIYYFIIISSLITSCIQKENPFEIDIETKGYDDHTLLYLTDVETDVAIDSGYIINSKLVFSLELKEPTQLILLTDYKIREDFEYKFFWKENRRMTIRAEKGNLRNAEINGSELQSQVDLLNSGKAHLQEKLDSLQNEINSISQQDEEKINTLKIAQKDILKEMTAIDVEYIKQHPDYLNSVIVLTSVAKNFPKKQTVELYENLNPEVQSTKYGEAVKKYLALKKDIGVEGTAIDFLIPDLEGNMVQLNKFENKYILLDFWASWCAPCRKENKVLLKNYKKYKDKGFEIIGVNLDKKRNDWEKAVEKDGIIWTNASGNENDITITYNIQSLPKNYIIDPNGVIIAEDIVGDQLEAKLKEIYSY